MRKISEKAALKSWSEIVKVYTYSEARKRLAEILNIAREEDVMIQGRGGEVFTIVPLKRNPVLLLQYPV